MVTSSGGVRRLRAKADQALGMSTVGSRKWEAADKVREERGANHSRSCKPW